MKRRSLSLLLALSMVFSMLSMASIPVAAAGPTLTAYQTEKNRVISVDGKINEPQWIVDTPVGTGSYIGALCDVTALYLALETQAPSASIVINGNQIDANLGSSPSISVGEIAGSEGKYEISLPLAALGLTFNAGRTLPMSVAAGSDSAQFTLDLGSQGMIKVFRGQSATAADFYSTHGFSNGSFKDKVYAETDGTVVFDYDGDTYTSVHSTSVPFNSVSPEGFIMSFDADFDALPQYDMSSAKHPANFGLFFYMCNGSTRYDMAFWCDEDNQIVFCPRQPTNSASRSKAIYTGLTTGTEEAKNVKVRITTNPDGDVSLYMNGELKGTVTKSRYESTTGGQTRFFADHRTALTKQTRAEFRNFFYREYVPGEIEVKTYDGTSLYDAESGSGHSDATAYLDLAGITMDGDLSDNQWYLSNAAAYRIGSDAPAAHAGFLWDDKNLYVGIQTFSKTPMVSAQISFGDKLFTADLASSTVSAGDMLSSFQQYEWAIPMSDIGLKATSDSSIEYALATTNASGGVSGMQGKLTLSGQTIVFGETADSLDTREYSFTKVTNTTITQGNKYFDFSTDPSFTAGNEIAQIFKAVDFDGKGYELTFDLTIHDLPYFTATRGWRGWAIEIREGLENRNPKLQTRFNLRTDGGNNVIMDILYLGSDYVSVDTGVDLGQRAVFKMVVTDELTPTLYVNDKEVFTFPTLNRNHFGITDTLPMPRIIIQGINHNRAVSNDGTVHSVNVEMHDLLWTQSKYANVENTLKSALSSLTEASVLNGNQTDDLKGKLNLPSAISPAGLTDLYPVTWSLKDTNTGAKLDCIDLTTGQIRANGKPAAVTLTATVSAESVSFSKSFQFSIKGTAANGKVAFIEHDMDARVGAAKDFTRDHYVFFDGDYNSVVYDQGSAKRINRIVLTDSDKFSRASINDLGVYTSNDNKTYTKVTGWELHQDGPAYYLYNLDVTARYIKVHSYQDVVDTIEWQPSFYNNIQSLMTVSYDANLLGAKSAFAKSAEVTVSGDGKDVPVYVSLEQIGAKAGEYQAGTAADFRFTQGSKLLAHWYDGKSGFYVRVPEISGTAKVTAHWGNASAKDISDGEATFEPTYGNVISHNITHTTALTDDGVALTLQSMLDNGAMAGDGRSFTFPNGNVIIVGNSDKYDLAYSLSTDGGRTFSGPIPLVDKTAEDIAKYGTRGTGFGGFMWDESVPGRQRLWMIAYSSAGYTPEDLSKSDCRMVLFWTDDMGKTWNADQRRFLSIQGATPVSDNDIFYQNAKARPYMLTYCDGLVLKGADGAGPNVDYVIWHGMQSDNNGSFNGASIYSTDGGESWWHSENTVSMPGKAGHEYGISEGGLAQLDDGTIYAICRAQDDSNDYFYQAFSYDLGKTWSDIGPSEVISTNTHPLLTTYKDVRLLMWSGNNSLGGNARQRTPMSLGISTDNYKSYDKVMSLTFSTTLDTLKDSTRRLTQPSLFFSPDGNEAFVCWTDLKGRPYNTGTAFNYRRSTEAMLIEEFDDMIFGNKGAYDDFESTALHSEGWLSDDDQDMTLSTEKAATGERSMKLTDSKVVPVYATRMIPSIKKGNVGASMYIPSGNTTDFVMELKAGYNYKYLKHTIAGFGVTPEGDVYVAHDSGKNVVAKVKLNVWNDFAISMDMTSGEKGTLYVNGKAVSRIDLMDKGNEVTAVQFSAPVHSATLGSHAYVDNFFVTEANLTHGPARNTFTDVAKDAWYAEAVSFALDNSIMGGYNATTFGPNDTLSRAMVVQVLYNKEGQPAISGAHKFPDVAATQWYNNAITWASQNGVVGGYGDGRFGPNDNVTLEQAAVILWNYSGNPAATGSLGAIGTHSDWAANALRWCAAEGLLEGIPFDAVTGAATRAQTAHLLMNYLNK